MQFRRSPIDVVMYYDRDGEHVTRQNEDQIAKILKTELEELCEIYAFNKEVVQERMEKQVALMTVVACLCNVMKYGGS